MGGTGLGRQLDVRGDVSGAEARRFAALESPEPGANATSSDAIAERPTAPPSSQIVSIRWANDQKLCFDISHATDKGSDIQLEVRGCADDPHGWDEFVVPLFGEIGSIKAVKYPDYCLQTQDNSAVSFRPCAGLPVAHMLWMADDPSQGGTMHHVRLAADNNLCLGVPEAGLVGQTYVEIQACPEVLVAGPAGDFLPPVAEHHPGGQTLIMERTPIDCLWEDWSEWTRCSRVCGAGHSSRVRSVLRGEENRGLPCTGDRDESKTCFGHACGEETANLAASPILWVVLLLLLLTCCVLGMLMRRHGRKQGRSAEDDESAAVLLRHSNDEQPCTASGRSPEVREACVQAQVVTCPKRHELRLVRGQRPNKWKCDGIRAEAGCLSGITHHAHHEVDRYRCETCDFDLCAECYRLQQQQGQDGSNGRTMGEARGLPGRGRWSSPSSQESTPRTYDSLQQEGRSLIELGPGCVASIPSPKGTHTQPRSGPPSESFRSAVPASRWQRDAQSGANDRGAGVGSHRFSSAVE